MTKSKITQLFLAATVGLLVSCSIENNENSDQAINELKDGQQVILKKIASLEKSVANIAIASKNKAADNKKQQPPQADPNKVYNIDIGDSFSMGPKDAKVTIIKWTDFQWPHCARAVSLIDDIVEKYPNDVQNVIKNFPLSFHKQAKKAAIYALAAERQGKYKDLYRKIMENYRNLKTNEDLPRQYAQELGLDMAKFDEDMKDPALEARIDKEINQMRQSGIPRLSVPKFLINGKEPQGGRNIENYSAIIDAELKKK